MVLFNNLKKRIDSSLRQEPQDSDAKRPQRLEGFLSGSLGGDGKVSWGLVILVLAALYALIMFVVNILKLFG